jgi:hypothetical protein
MGDNFWPDPLELMDLKDAVDARRTRVIIGDKEFKIRYLESTFHVVPIEVFVPCGYFAYDTAFDEILIKEEDGR